LGGIEGGAEENASGPTSQVVLNDQESRIYKLVDGKRSVAMIMEMTGLSDFDVCRTLFDFMDRNLVAPAGQESSRRETPVGKPTPTRAPSDGLGFVALGVVVIMTAVGGVVSWGTPFRVPATPSFLEQEAVTIRESRDVVRLSRLGSALQTYYTAFGVYPTTLDDLVNASPALVGAEDLKGVDGEPFQYQSTPDRIVLQAIGPSGEPYLSIVRKILPEEVILPGPPSIESSDP